MAEKMLGTIQRSATEQMQIAIKEYKGKSYLDMRIFYTTNDGADWIPTKKGVTCSPENLEILKDAIEEAIKEFTTEE
ncbi:MAG: transcriptional coactivator p15 [Candidatus Melainabacteria bacterium]|nr:MAG: transcriptional coactivator p15 [Candidatus Melainabacteria bacterium]